MEGGLTIGAPIAYSVKNKDSVIERLPTPTNPRPGHADLAGCQNGVTGTPGRSWSAPAP